MNIYTFPNSKTISHDLAPLILRMATSFLLPNVSIDMAE